MLYVVIVNVGGANSGDSDNDEVDLASPLVADQKPIATCHSMRVLADNWLLFSTYVYPILFTLNETTGHMELITLITYVT